MESLDRYITLIKSGEAVAFPTETVYGLGADAWNLSAIKKVFEIKGRPSDNPLIVHISDKNQISDFANHLPESAKRLATFFWPGPLSLVLKKRLEVPDVVTAGLDTVAIRMPDHILALEFISKTGPLVAPSANKSGRPSPTKAEHVRDDFGETFPVIEACATKIGLESTVIDVSGDEPTILRPGSISRKQIEEVLGYGVHESFFHPITAKSPGQKYSHYKPKAQVRWLTEFDLFENTSIFFLMMNSETEAQNIINYNRDVNQLAGELYDRFRQADIDGYSSVVIEPFEELEFPIVSALLNRVEKAIS